jgi:hypothetical protein
VKKIKGSTKWIVISTITVLCAGCLSSARLSDFSGNAAAIDFDRYANKTQAERTALWTGKTSNEYFLERDTAYIEADLNSIARRALTRLGYAVDEKNTVPGTNRIVGQRGMHANEWNSITGVYYKIDMEKNKTQVYIITKITQDITGGWRENRAAKVGMKIETMMDGKE